jgi:glycosyltransferase involved in cell wall biosynthesis
MPDVIASATALSGVRICMATSGHPADDDRIFFKEARTLAKAGADVVVLCARDKKPPAQPDGVRFATYAGGGRLRDRARSLGALEQAIVGQRCDVVHCHEPDSLVAALRAKRHLGVKVIFDSHELWAGVAAVRFPQPLWPLAMAAYRVFERRWVARCDAAVGASHAISKYLSSILGPNRVETILNVPVVEIFGEHAGRTWGEETVLCHDGSLTFERGLKPMAEAVRLLAARHRVVLKIVGDVFGAEKAWLDSFVAKHRLGESFVRTGWLPYGDVGGAIAPCHIGLISFLPSPNHLIAAPNKCFNYLLYGLPVVGPDYPRSHFAILEREGCARLMDPTSPEACAATISAMISDRAGTGRMADMSDKLSKQKYRWEHMEPVLLDLYRRVLRP